MHFDSAISLSILGLAFLIGYAEYTGLFNAPYGRFRNPRSRHRLPKRLSKLLRLGALPTRASSAVTYGIGFVFAAAMYAQYGSWSSPYHVLTGAFLMGQYGKRLVESLYIHRYSGTVSYAMAAYMALANFGVMAVCIRNIFRTPPAPTEDTYPTLLWPVPLVLVAWSGNFYHHLILREMRDGEGDTSYHVPRRGWFLRATCPQYFFEVLAWFGFALVVNRSGVYAILFLIAAKLAGRSQQIREWSWRHLEGYPRDVSRMVPFLY